SAAEPERPAMAFNELPDQIRRELPQLVIGGAMYSQTPANRMLILNGQVFHEGDKVAGELMLEQIRLKSAVLAYKGYRYNINY
ncbi:MAG: general secretion pathway protein GspB, partial [Rhizobacter sp.]|nr:general secretion pathway protein GspB [Rhizobacter sp.]